MSLISLHHEVTEVYSKIMESEGEITPDQEATLREFVQKVDNCVLFISLADSEVERLKGIAAEFAQTAKRIEARRQWMLDTAKAIMVSTGEEELTGTMMKFVLQKNPPSVRVTDASLIDSTYFIQKPPPPPELDKKRVLAEWKMGAPIDGVEITQEVRAVAKTNSILTKGKKAPKEIEGASNGK